MSGTCGNCDCASKSQCVKKGNNNTADIIVAEKSFDTLVVMEDSLAEHGGKCSCGSSCACVNCTCGQ